MDYHFYGWHVVWYYAARYGVRSTEHVEAVFRYSLRTHVEEVT